MEIYQAYLQAQKTVTDFLTGAGGDDGICRPSVPTEDCEA